MSSKNDSRENMKYDYKYLYRYPDEKTPQNGEIAFERFFKAHAETVGLDFTVELIGIQDKSLYFGSSPAKCKANEIVISSSIRDKFNWEAGDTVTLTDTINNEERKLLVKDVIDFAYGMYMFTNINEMRNYYDTGSEYWNVHYSNEPIEISDDQLAVALEKDACIKGAESRINSLMGTFHRYS